MDIRNGRTRGYLFDDIVLYDTNAHPLAGSNVDPNVQQSLITIDSQRSRHGYHRAEVSWVRGNKKTEVAEMAQTLLRVTQNPNLAAMLYDSDGNEQTNEATGMRGFFERLDERNPKAGQEYKNQESKTQWPKTIKLDYTKHEYGDSGITETKSEGWMTGVRDIKNKKDDKPLSSKKFEQIVARVLP